MAGETTRPSINDHVATGVGGTFLGEALFRMASLLLEGGGANPGFWREAGAAIVSPPTGFNRLVFGDRFDAVFPSRAPATYARLRVGVTVTADAVGERAPVDVLDRDAGADFTLFYGLPGQPGYRYQRPFDLFLFTLSAVPDVRTAQDAVEHLSIHGLLVGRDYAIGDAYRGAWGLFGGLDYLSPRIFRLSSTSVSLGTVGQWWLSRAIALQGTALAGVGFGAAGTVADGDERDYRWGVIPQALLALRVLFGDRVAVEASGRRYYVLGEPEGEGSLDRFELDLVNRATAEVAVRVAGPHAVGIRYALSTRDARIAGLADPHQVLQTVSLAYIFLGQPGFGAVEWRPASAR